MKRYFIAEIAVSLGFNIVLAGLATWLLSDWPAATSGRFAGASADIVLATVGPLLGMVAPITLMTRRRVARGAVAALAPAGPGTLRFPHNLALRTLVLCPVAIVTLGLPAAALLAAMAPQGAAFLLFKILYGAVIALLVTPIVLVAALRDGALQPREFRHARE